MPGRSSTAGFLLHDGPAARARAGYDRALTIAEALTRDDPKNLWYQSIPGYVLRGRGMSRLALGDFKAATADIHRSLAIWDKIPT